MTDFKSYIKTLTIIHFALVAGQVIFIAVVTGLNGSTKILLDAEKDPLIFAVPGLALIVLVAGAMLGKKLAETAAQKATLNEKLHHYRSALILRYAMIEGASLFGIVAYFLSGNFFFIIVSIVMILVMAMLRPTRHKIEEDLKIQLPA